MTLAYCLPTVTSVNPTLTDKTMIAEIAGSISPGKPVHTRYHTMISHLRGNLRVPHLGRTVKFTPSTREQASV